MAKHVIEFNTITSREVEKLQEMTGENETSVFGRAIMELYAREAAK